MTIGWLSNINSADNYFLLERIERDCWNRLEASGDTEKTAALIMGYNRLYYGSEFVLPTYAEASAEQLVVLRKANCEMSYYLACHLFDEDIRKNLQAQGVTDAGIVKEKYDKDMLMTVPIPPFVYDMLFAAGFKAVKKFKIVELERDENEDLKK